MKRSMTSRTGLDESTRMLKAFADPIRLRLLNLLGGERKEAAAFLLHGAPKLPRPTVSRHLAYLRKHGLVVGRKEGLWVHYHLAKPRTGLHRILLGCLGTCLGDPEIFRQDQERMARRIACCGGRE